MIVKFIFERLSTSAACAALFLALSLFSAAAVTAQNVPPGYKSQEISETDGIPVLIKHLPDWRSVRESATLTNNVEHLRSVLGDRPVFDLLDFTGGTEAATAQYPEGKLLVVEYMTPQASVDADSRFSQRVAELGPSSSIVYRRIGNYNAFVFDSTDVAAANALLDRIEYQKTVQWLGEDPHLLRRLERAFVVTTSDIFFSTVLVILIGLGSSMALGILSGFLYFRYREGQRGEMQEFSDAGGMTRLNLDGLTPDILPERLLND